MQLINFIFMLFFIIVGVYHFWHDSPVLALLFIVPALILHLENLIRDIKDELKK